jgi:hypothetical protein
MNKLFLTFALIISLSTLAQKRIALLCTNFKINNETREDGATYRKSLESVLSNLKHPPLIVDRENLPELLIKIQEEANLNRDLKTSIPVLKATNIDYIMYGNFDKKVVNDTYDLQLEAIKISGENTFSKKIFPIVKFTEKELVKTETFRQKLNELFSSYAFTEEFGIIENEQLEKINKRLDEKDAEIKSLKSEMLSVEEDGKKKNKTINSLTEVVGKMQTENALKDVEIKRLNSEVRGIKDYSDIAQLDALGLKQRWGSGITGWQTELYRLMNQVIIEKKGTVQFQPTDSALLILDTVIKKYPKFPFSYWAKSMILMKRKDSTWSESARKAYDILEVTTSIEGHKPVHEYAFGIMKQALEFREKGVYFPLVDDFFP